MDLFLDHSIVYLLVLFLKHIPNQPTEIIVNKSKLVLLKLSYSTTLFWNTYRGSLIRIVKI